MESIQQNSCISTACTPVRSSHAGRVHHAGEQVALRIYRDTALDLLTGVVPAPPPFSTVLTDCESRIVILGVALRSRGTRPCLRRAWLTRFHVPLPGRTRNCSCAVRQEVEFSGNCLHWQPVFTPNKSASATRCSSCLCGRPPHGGHSANASIKAPVELTAHRSYYSDT